MQLRDPLLWKIIGDIWTVPTSRLNEYRFNRLLHGGFWTTQQTPFRMVNFGSSTVNEYSNWTPNVTSNWCLCFSRNATILNPSVNGIPNGGLGFFSKAYRLNLIAAYEPFLVFRWSISFGPATKRRREQTPQIRLWKSHVWMALQTAQRTTNSINLFCPHDLS